MLLPDPEQVAALVRLAGHDDADVQQQAWEICRALPPPVRIHAAERLADMGRLFLAIRCVWPDPTPERDALARRLAIDAARQALPVWEANLLNNLHLRHLIDAAEGAPERRRDRILQQRLRAVQGAVLRAPDAYTRAAAAAGKALLAETPDKALRDAVFAAGYALGDIEAMRRWAAARFSRLLNDADTVDPPLRRALAEAFANSLDHGALDRARMLLTSGCVYQLRSKRFTGPDAILHAYQDSIDRAKNTFDAVDFHSTVAEVHDREIRLDVADRIRHAGQTHTYHSRQRLWFNGSGRIWRIAHEDRPGEADALRAFLRRVGLRE
ncbi:MAG: hypothetical protein AAFV53_02695 [Myxococcota bacterium]